MEAEIEEVVRQAINQNKVLSADLINIVAIATQLLDKRRDVLLAADRSNQDSGNPAFKL